MGLQLQACEAQSLFLYIYLYDSCKPTFAHPYSSSNSTSLPSRRSSHRKRVSAKNLSKFRLINNHLPFICMIKLQMCFSGTKLSVPVNNNHTELCKVLINYMWKDNSYVHLEFIFNTNHYVVVNREDNIQYWVPGINSKEQGEF